jgi:hypothetical protein
LNYSEFCALGTWVIGANMQCKLFVALRLEVLRHFIKGIASGRARRGEHPSTLGTTKTSKTLFFDPYKPAEHPMERPIVCNKHGVGPYLKFTVTLNHDEVPAADFGEASANNLTRMSASLSVNWVTS